MFDINAVIKEAEDEVAAEQLTRAKAALKSKMRELASARQVVANIERELGDLKLRIADGEV